MNTFYLCQLHFGSEDEWSKSFVDPTDAVDFGVNSLCHAFNIWRCETRTGEAFMAEDVTEDTLHDIN